MPARARAATAADRDAIARVLRGCGALRADEIAVAMELVDGGLGGDPDYALLVADQDGVVGYACTGPTPMTRAAFDLYWIVVDARAQRRGVGAALLDAVEAHVRAAGGAAIRVETSASAPYAAARALYARASYPEVARLADFYAPGDAMIVYYKVL